MDFKKKYLRYKLKYLNIKNVIKGGTIYEEEPDIISEEELNRISEEADDHIKKFIDRINVNNERYSISKLWFKIPALR